MIRAFVVSARHDSLTPSERLMPLIRTLALAVSCCLMTACTAAVDQGPTSSTMSASDEPIRIVLDPVTPAKSLGSIAVNGTTNQFAVGYGKYGIASENMELQSEI